jgi:hypothetical protein
MMCVLKMSASFIGGEGYEGYDLPQMTGGEEGYEGGVL